MISIISTLLFAKDFINSMVDQYQYFKDTSAAICFQKFKYFEIICLFITNINLPLIFFKISSENFALVKYTYNFKMFKSFQNKLPSKLFLPV